MTMPVLQITIHGRIGWCIWRGGRQAGMSCALLVQRKSAGM